MNMAGFVIENILDGLVSQAQWSEALAAAEKVPAAVLLDTRTEGEFARGHVRRRQRPPRRAARSSRRAPA